MRAKQVLRRAHGRSATKRAKRKVSRAKQDLRRARIALAGCG